MNRKRGKFKRFRKRLLETIGIGCLGLVLTFLVYSYMTIEMKYYPLGAGFVSAGMMFGFWNWR